MTDRNTPAPETVNAEQEDGGAQAQTERAPGQGDAPGSTPDVVDHMRQMVSSGIIDMGAFRGERSDDDEEGMLGDAGIEDDTPRGR